MLELLVFVGLISVLMKQRSRIARLELRLSDVELRLAPTPTHFDLPAAAAKPPRQAASAPVAEEPVDLPPTASEAAATRLSNHQSEPPSPEPEPLRDLEPAPQADEQASGQPGFGFEDLFGRRLPIWAGGVTLAVAGVLIVRYSIEAGLLSPLVRFLSGLVFGAALLTGAEAALRAEHRLRDPRVRQALAGAGIASLYASILVAANVYALIGPTAAFLGMAAVTGLAMALSLRFGAPSALLGLVGGLAAPALVGAGAPDIPLLTSYLALAVGGLSVLSRVQRWMWLGVSALVGGLGWGGLLLLTGALDTAASVSIGIYILLIGIVVPMLALRGSAAGLVRILGSIVAVAQIAAMVATGGFSMLHWGLFGLISVAVILLSRREASLARLPMVGLGIALLLLGSWPSPMPATFALVLLGTVAIYGIPALLALWRPAGGLIEAGQIAILSLGATFVPAMHFYRADHSTDLALAAVSIASACFPTAAALLGWRNSDRRDDARFALLASTAGLLLSFAAIFAAPTAILPLLVGAAGVALLLLSLRAGDARIELSGWILAAAGVALLGPAATFDQELLRLGGEPEHGQQLISFIRWTGLSVLASIFAWRARLDLGRRAAQMAATLLAYGGLAQFVPGCFLPLLPAAALFACAVISNQAGSGRLLPAMSILLGVTSLWAIDPVAEWAAASLPSLGGEPLFVSELPSVHQALLRLFLPSLLIFSAGWIVRRVVPAAASRTAAAVGGALCAVGVHILYKQLFDIISHDAFVAHGLAERTLWQFLLFGAGYAAWKLGRRRLALGLSCAGLAHFGWYSLLLHNPLWAEQAVGHLPAINLLLPAYGLPLAWLWLVGRLEPNFAARIQRPRGLLQMLLVALLAFSMLRQIAQGPILSAAGVSAAEDIARSMLAVGLAVGFLLWGIAGKSRDWRIASLVLMLGAVAKVFLLDASGLEGLMRIASFVALGLSLIGIGWLYSRSLGTDRPLTDLR